MVRQPLAHSPAVQRLATLAAGVRLRWQSLAARERGILVAAGLLLALLVVWLIGIQPAWRTLQQAPQQLTQVEAQLQQMQRWADEARRLRAVAPLSSAQAGEALRAATERLGAGARLVVQGDRATLTLTGVSSEALRGWLAEARSAARARPVELQLTRAAAGFAGSITLAFGAGT